MPPRLRHFIGLVTLLNFAGVAGAAQPQAASPQEKPESTSPGQAVEFLRDALTCPCMRAQFYQAALASNEKWISDLEAAVKYVEDFQEVDRASQLQVDYARSALIKARSDLLTWEKLANDPNQFGRGKPARVHESLWRELAAQFGRNDEILRDAQIAFKRADAQTDLAPEKLRSLLRALFTQDTLVRGTTFAKKTPESWKQWAQAATEDIGTRLGELKSECNRLLDCKTEMEEKNLVLSEEQDLALKTAQFEFDLGSLEKALRVYEACPWKNAEEAEQGKIRMRSFRLVAMSAQSVLVWPRNERFRAIANLWPSLPAVSLKNARLQELAAKYQVQQKVVSAWYSQVEYTFERFFLAAEDDELKPTGTCSTCNPAALPSHYIASLDSVNDQRIKMYDIWFCFLAADAARRAAPSTWQ
jgi:hypothetical protein